MLFTTSTGQSAVPSSDAAHLSIYPHALLLGLLDTYLVQAPGKSVLAVFRGLVSIPCILRLYVIFFISRAAKGGGQEK